MKILLLGSGGMLGSDCKLVLRQGHELIAPSRTEMDITRWDVVIDSLQRFAPDVVLNCATPENLNADDQKDLLRKTIVEGTRNLAQGSARFGTKLFQISSGHVFDGQKPIPQPYFEDDPPRPFSTYGRSKLESETAVRENSPHYVILRSGWLYGLKGENFVKSIITGATDSRGEALKVDADQFGSPTWTYRLALQIKKLIEVEARGTFHATAEGFCSRLECARYILEVLGLKIPVEPCTLKDFPEAAKRPSNCLLENRSLKTRGLNVMVDWKADLERFLHDHGNEIAGKTRSGE
jgi:dTDP-4-dehydrorhamnose reductase